MIRPVIATLSAIALIGFALSGLFFASSVPATPYDDLLAQDSVQFAQRYFSLVDAKNWDTVFALSVREIRSSDTQAGFTAMANVIPNGNPDAIHVVGYHTITRHSFNIFTSASSDVERLDVVLEYLYPDKPLWADFVLRRDGDVFLAEGAHVRVLTQPLEEYYAFHFFGQNTGNYIVLFGAVALILFNAFALVRCITMPELRLKWLWIVFTLVGFSTVQYDWTDGVFSYGLLYAHLPAVTLVQGPFRPLTLTASLPLGAILFLLWRRLFASPDGAELPQYE